MMLTRPRSPVRAHPRPRLGPTATMGVLLAALAPMLGGCPSPDAEGKFNKFLDQTEDERADAANVKLDMGGSLADITGNFLFALRANISTYPLQFYATVTFTAAGDGGTFSMDLQPLSLNLANETEPREPVGDTVSFADVAVSAAGAFEAVTTTELRVPGMANPITGGDIAVQPGMKLTGVIQGPDVFCGTVDGMVTEPIPLALSPGSTFGAERVMSIDMLPTTVIKECPMPDGGTSSGTTGPAGSSTTDGSTSAATTDGTTAGTDTGTGTTDATGTGTTTDGTSGGSTTAG